MQSKWLQSTKSGPFFSSFLSNKPALESRFSFIGSSSFFSDTMLLWSVILLYESGTLVSTQTRG